ncbi:MAG: Ldh family oxidoreductase [Pseudomonadota bacterium]
MSTTPGTALRLSPETLHHLVTRVFARLGSRGEDAARIADMLVWSDLTGRTGHGVARVPDYVRMAQAGTMDVAAVPVLERALPATLLMDARRAPGPVAMTLATQWAMERARAAGGCFALVKRTTHTGAIGFYARMAADAGFAALIFGSGKPLMACHGARVASLSTSPLALAVPGGAGGPLLLDMATSVTSLGRLRQLAAQDADIPEGWALTAEGGPARRAREAAIPLPLGGPKGSGLAVLFEAMTGVLAGAPVVVPALLGGAAAGRGASAMVMVMDIAAFSPPESFAAEVEALRATLKGLPRLDGVEEIFLPGERSRAGAARRAKEGIAVPAALLAELEALAGDDR